MNPYNLRASVDVEFKKLTQDAVAPTYSSEEAAGADLHSREYAFIRAGDRRLIKTGIALQLQVGFEAQIRPRSGLALKNGVTVLNTPGTIDSDYRGEIGVILMNHGDDPFIVNVGDRIAQLVIAPVWRGFFYEIKELEGTARGEGGFGSTGV